MENKKTLMYKNDLKTWALMLEISLEDKKVNSCIYKTILLQLASIY